MLDESKLTATGALNLSVFHDWDVERLFVIITVCIDESGTHAGSPLMTLGCRIARLGQWVDFDKKWKRLLKEKQVEYFHAKEFRSRSKQFQGWDDRRRNDFLTAAQKIARRHLLCGSVATLRHDDYSNLYRAATKPRRFRVDSKYGLCFRATLHSIVPWLSRSLPKGDHQINFIVESGPGTGGAKAIFDEVKAVYPTEFAASLGTLTYGEKKKIPGLQAADLIAFSALKTELRGSPALTALPTGHTVQQGRKLRRANSAQTTVLRIAVDDDFINRLLESAWEASRVPRKTHRAA